VTKWHVLACTVLAMILIGGASSYLLHYQRLVLIETLTPLPTVTLTSTLTRTETVTWTLTPFSPHTYRTYTPTITYTPYASATQSLTIVYTTTSTKTSVTEAGSTRYEGTRWAFASMNPSRSEDDTLSKGATGVAFWAYKAPGNDYFSHLNSLHSFHVNVALQKPAGASHEPSFHFGLLVSPNEPGAGSPSIRANLSDETQAEGSTTRWDIKIPRGDISSRSWFKVVQDGQDSSGKWKWEYTVYVYPEDKWYYVTTVYVDSPYIGRSPNMNAEIAEGGGVSTCDDRFTPITFHRVHVLKNGVWKNIPYLVVDYTTNNLPFEDNPAMDWDIIDSIWATASTRGRDTPRGTEWNEVTQ